MKPLFWRSWPMVEIDGQALLLTHDCWPALDWIVCGGESGKGARPMHPDWARSLRDQCASAGVPFHFKQWGEWLPANIEKYADFVSAVPADGRTEPLITPCGFSGELRDVYGQQMWRIGKARAGRLLDSVQHDGFPA